MPCKLLLLRDPSPLGTESSLLLYFVISRTFSIGIWDLGAFTKGVFILVMMMIHVFQQ